jgi:hypothetical protein
VRQISSKLTFYYKRIFPIIWFGLLVVFLVMAVLGITSTNDSFPAMPLIVPIVMAVVGYTFMKKLVFDLVDEVFDDGNALVVRNGGKEDRIALSNIVNVSYSPYVNPPRVTLSLRRPSVFGERISFCAPARFIPFASSPVIDDLIKRVDAARRSDRRP